jgi:hypothetical protein
MLPSRDESAQPFGLSVRTCRLLAGLEVGFAGGLAVLAWLCVHSVMSGELWWAKLNVASGLFYGAGVYSMGLGRATLAGASLLILLYTFAAVIFAQIVPVTGYARNALFALAFSAAMNLAGERWVWPRLDPFAPAYFPFQVMLAGHLLFALALGRFTGRFSSLAQTFGDATWVVPAFQGSEPLAEIPTEPPTEPPAQPLAQPEGMPAAGAAEGPGKPSALTQESSQPE